jgi:hypothetical protein
MMKRREKIIPLQALELDFRRPPAGSPLTGWLLLGLGVALGLQATYAWRESRAAVREAQQQLAGMSGDSSRMPARASAEEIAVATDTAQRLALSWEGLFGALEAAASDKVALLSVEPDPKGRTVLISGHSRDVESALGYVKKLRETPALHQVHLVKHEFQKEDPRRPVSFSVAASWSEGKR